jgi:hypothetical protein
MAIALRRKNSWASMTSRWTSHKRVEMDAEDDGQVGGVWVAIRVTGTVVGVDGSNFYKRLIEFIFSLFLILNLLKIIKMLLYLRISRLL